MIKYPQKFLSYAGRAIFGLGVAYTLFLAILYFYLQRDPHELAREALAEVSQATGLQFAFGSLDVTLLPLPAVSLSDLSITGRQMELHAGWVSARPSFLQILRGNFMPCQITAIRPKFTFHGDFDFADPTRALKQAKALLPRESGSQASLLPADFTINIINGQATIDGSHDSRLTLDSLQADIGLSQGGDYSGQLRFAALRLRKGEDILGSLENFFLKGRFNIMDVAGTANGLHASGRARWPGLVHSLDYDLWLESSRAGWSGQGALAGDLDVEGAFVPVKMSGRATRLANGPETAFRGIDWQLGDDSGSLDLTLTLPDGEKQFSMSGTLLGHRLSLPQWLGFSRNFPPGLQLALDNIIKARVDFKIDSRGLEAPRIEATCTGARFSGSGSVADFSRPVVFLDMRAPEVNLGLAIPESVGKPPVGPSFGHPSLTPTASAPLQPGETGIDYDIRLAADRVTYGPLTISNASTRIYPGKMDGNGLQDVLLDGKGDLYDGKFAGSCIFGGAKSLPMHITATARNINGLKISRDMPVLPFKQGLFNGSATVTSRGKELDVFLANLKGQLSAEGQKAALKGVPKVFSRMEARADLRSGNWRNRILALDGGWSAKGHAEDMEVSASVDGKLQFGESFGMSFKNLPGKLSVRPKIAMWGLPQNSAIALKGDFSGQLDKNRFSVANGLLEVAGIQAKLAAQLDGSGKQMQYSGSLSAQVANINAALSNLGFRAGMPDNWSRAKLETNFAGQENRLSLESIRASMGNTAISGKLEWQEKNSRPFYSFDLTLDKLDLTALDTGKSAPEKTWNFAFMKDFDAAGTLRCKELIVAGMRARQIVMPMKLESGTLATGPNTAIFYGANLQGSANVDFRKGLALKGNVATRAFNLGALARDFKIDATLTGLATLNSTVSAQISGPGQLAGALNGEWSFELLNGSWQGHDKKGAPTGKPTLIDRARASGTIKKGLMESGNILLQNSSLRVDGEGWFNLATDKLDFKLNVNMKNVPDFPLYIYGKVGDYKTSIGAGKLVINAIGGITSGIGDILGGMIKGVWNIFR